MRGDGNEYLVRLEHADVNHLASAVLVENVLPFVRAFEVRQHCVMRIIAQVQVGHGETFSVC